MNAPGASELSRLVVIDPAKVGPAKVEGDRIAAAYRVGEEVFELAYKYEEPVLDPEDPETSNLASIILAQVALNYGLFCREIVFHGPFDETDRRFLPLRPRPAERGLCGPRRPPRPDRGPRGGRGHSSKW